MTTNTLLVEEKKTPVDHEPSQYLKYLPALFTERDEFMGRFLRIFEDIFTPIEQVIAQVHLYFDPKMTQPRTLVRRCGKMGC